jgi:hypothetical protein
MWFLAGFRSGALVGEWGGVLDLVFACFSLGDFFALSDRVRGGALFHEVLTMVVGQGFFGWSGLMLGCCFLGSARSVLADFFITISHCPWRDFISLSNSDKETKQRKRLSTANS